MDCLRKISKFRKERIFCGPRTWTLGDWELIMRRFEEARRWVDVPSSLIIGIQANVAVGVSSRLGFHPTLFEPECCQTHLQHGLHNVPSQGILLPVVAPIHDDLLLLLLSYASAPTYLRYSTPAIRTVGKQRHHQVHQFFSIKLQSQFPFRP